MRRGRVRPEKVKPEKAIFLPSGDQAGEKSKNGLVEILASSEPSGLIVKMCESSAPTLTNAILPFLPGKVASAGRASTIIIISTSNPTATNVSAAAASVLQ